MNPNQDVNPNADEIANLEAQIAQIDVTKLDPSDNMKVKQEPQIVETKQPETTVEIETTEGTEDPIKSELDRIKGQTQGKTPKEKFEYKLQREIAQAKEMGIDVSQFVVKPQIDDEDGEKPLTRKDLEEAIRNVKPQSKSAVEMANEITNEAERELHLHYLDNKINPNLTEDEKFQTAKDMVNGIKLKNQINLSNIKPEVRTHSTGSSFQPNIKQTFDKEKLTPEEIYIMEDANKRGVPISKEEILKMR